MSNAVAEAEQSVVVATVPAVSRKPVMVEIDDELLRKIKVPRLADLAIKNGFQRKLSDEKVQAVVIAAQKGTVIPPVILARIIGTGEIVCPDGQHRVEARRRYPFPLVAQVIDMTWEQAVSTFCTINSTAAKVSLRHVLMVDTEPYAVRLRRLVGKFGGDVQQMHNLMYGILGANARNKKVTDADWKIADEIMAVWSADKRWKSIKRGANKSVYNRPGVLMMIGSLGREYGDSLAKKLTILKKIDFSSSKPFAKRYGTHNTWQKEMKALATRFLAKSL